VYWLLPAFCGRAIQLPALPNLWTKLLRMASSSCDHGPRFTLVLSQHGDRPIASIGALVLS